MPQNGPQPPLSAAVRPRIGPVRRSDDFETRLVVDLTSIETDSFAPLPELVPAGPVIAEVGGDRPMGRPTIDLSNSTDFSGGGHAWEPFELSRSTAELLPGVHLPDPDVDEQPPPTAKSPDQPQRTPWPEIRFYIGSAALFFVAFIFATAVWVVLPTAVLGWNPTAITSGSMEPAIRVGDVVVGNPAIPDDLAVGSVVTFEVSPGRLITHRVVGRAGDGAYITRGDANSDPDRPPVDREDIQSVGRILVPYAGYPSVWVQSGAWWAVALLALAAAGLVIASRWALLDRFNPWNDGDDDAHVEAER